MRVPGYDYETLLRTVGERDCGQCWVRGLLLARREAQVAAWDGGQADGRDPTCAKNWIPKKLLDCDGVWDADHLGLSKSWLKSNYPLGGILYDDGLYRINYMSEVEKTDLPYRSLADLWNDPRNCVLVDRRHHDMRGNSLIVVRRADLPEHVEEFAAELGDKAVARLERDFGRVSPVGSAQARSTAR